ncbi:MAG: hypothetical protein V1742_08515, partial [Pseudomonadota bacterium]
QEDKNLRVDCRTPCEYRVSAEVKGKGMANVYAVWYDSEGKFQAQYLSRVYLTDEFRNYSAPYTLPAEARAMRIGFQFRQGYPVRSTLIIASLTIQLRESDK